MALLSDFDFVVGWDDFVFLELIRKAYSPRQIQSIRFDGQPHVRGCSFFRS